MQLEQDLDWAIELQGRQLDLLHQMMEHLPEAMAVIDHARMVVQLNGRMQALGTGGLRSDISLRDLAQDLGLPADTWDELVTLSAQPDASLRVRCPVGERSVYLKTTTFNGVPLPSIWLWDSETDQLECIKRFDYEDFRNRLS